MTLEDTIFEALYYYPTLFQKRIDVLVHLFLTVGNGLEWVDGELVDISPREKEEPDINYANASARSVDYSYSQRMKHIWGLDYCRLTSIPDDIQADYRQGAVWLLNSIISGKSKFYREPVEEDLFNKLKVIRNKLLE